MTAMPAITPESLAAAVTHTRTVTVWWSPDRCTWHTDIDGTRIPQ